MSAETQASRTLTDQLGRSLSLAASPCRIVSLCPSVTETLFALGAGGRVVARTDYCRHPAEAIMALPSIGGTKRVDETRLRALAPDLVVSIREENDEAQIAALSQDLPVLILDPVDIASALSGIRLLGGAVGHQAQGQALAQAIADAFDALPRLDHCEAAYLIWRKPFMVAGHGTYIGDVMARLGFVNIAGTTERYPILDARTLEARQPKFLLAASEPFPFSEKYVPELRRLAPGARVVLVDGEMFGWHGARMLKAADYFHHQIPLWKAALGQA